MIERIASTGVNLVVLGVSVGIFLIAFIALNALGAAQKPPTIAVLSATRDLSTPADSAGAGWGRLTASGFSGRGWAAMDELGRAGRAGLHHRVCTDNRNLDRTSQRRQPHPMRNADFAIAASQALEQKCGGTMPTTLVRLIMGEMGEEFLLSNRPNCLPLATNSDSQNLNRRCGMSG